MSGVGYRRLVFTSSPRTSEVRDVLEDFSKLEAALTDAQGSVLGCTRVLAVLGAHEAVMHADRAIRELEQANDLARRQYDVLRRSVGEL